ncbi:MAG: ADP-glyceromanno-heptose 6-epimerase [Chlamydiales bacterium]
MKVQEMPKMSKQGAVVITGAAGFIGSGIVRYLNDHQIDHLILVDDIGTTEKWKNLVGKRFIDILPSAKLHSWLKEHADEVSAIIHMGACSDTTEKDGDFLIENNYRYSVRLAEIALEKRILFIYASSAATYGDGSLGFSDDHDCLETLVPLNMYGYSKHLFDLWLKRQGALNHVVGLKYFNVFGPNERHKGRMASAITQFLPQVQKGAAVRLFRSDHPQFKDGEQQRDFIYVKDAVTMTCSFLHISARGIFNIGRGQPSTWNQLAYSVFKAVGKKPEIEYIDMPRDLIGKYQYYTCAPMQKTQQALGVYSACHPLEEAVEDYVCNYLIPEKTW